MPSSLTTTLAFAVGRALTRLLDLVGDPIGRLETSPDMVELSARVRVTPVKKSITGFLITADHAVCSDVLKSPHWRTQPETTNLVERLFLGSNTDPERVDPFLDAVIAKDGEEHARVRRLIQPAFTHRVIQGWKDSAERIAHQLLDEIQGQQEIDFVESLANPLPLIMICEILGVPLDDRDKFTKWGRTLAVIGLDLPRSSQELRELEAASDELTAYIAALLQQRRTEPADDLLSILAMVESHGETLSDKEIIATASFLLIAGFETTVNLLSVGTLVLLENRDELASVSVHHDLLPNLVEEALRVVSPVQYTTRTAASDVQLPDGTRVRRGQTIVLLLAGANRDPKVFEQPDLFRIDRANARKNIAFGYGVHHCIGAQLARLEAESLWRELLLRYPDTGSWQLVGAPLLRPGKTIRGLEAMPMTLGKVHGAPTATVKAVGW